ncbi:Ig domain-containing protein [Psychromonas arctica]|uniref:Ig domain-containing protein n=1 Tax=Psychromonas arctica TaxID=168275 RepID=UPI0003F6032D|nr:Ig domain-containing protein [Psychromonas arctica]
MINKKTCIAVSIALALTACGGSSDGSSGGSSGETSSKLTAIDGYLENAELWVDTNDNLMLDSGDTKLADNSDENGQFTLTAEQQNHAVFVKAIAGETIDSVRGAVSTDFELSAPAGSSVANPMTNMVIQQLAANPTLSQADAEDAVIKSIQDTGLTASRDLIFGDYLIDTSNQQAQALNIIAESLVDNADQSFVQQLKIASAVAAEVQKVVEAQGNLNRFYPTVTITDGEVTAVANSRPVVTGTVATQTIEFQGALIDIDTVAYFSDDDNDALTYQLVLKGNNELNGLSINKSTGIVTGTPTIAGTFEYQVFASDGKARSYPLNFTVKIESANTAPTVNQAIAEQLQAEVSNWELTVGEAVDYTLDISALFTDAESDVLNYLVDTTFTADGFANGSLSFSEQNGIITFSGTPSYKQLAQVNNLYVYADDSVNTKVITLFKLPAITESSTPSETTNKLDGHKWYLTEYGSTDLHYTERVWCDTLEFVDGIVYKNERTSDNLTTCSDNTSTEVGSYTIDELNTLNASFTFNEREETITQNLTYTVQVTDDNIENAILVLTKPTNSNENGELYTYFSTAAAAEKRIALKSDGSATERDIEVYLPSDETETWKKGLITVSLLENNNSQDSGQFDANITFGLEGESVTCNSLQQAFDEFVLTDNTGVVNSDFDCYDNEDEGSANIDLDIEAQLAEGGVYSIIGHTSGNGSEYIEAVKFNIQWTGTGNND